MSAAVERDHAPAQMGARSGGGRLILATSLGEAKGGLAVAAAVAVALGCRHPSVLLAELGADGTRGPTMLAAGSARELEDALRHEGFDRVAARGRLCWLGLSEDEEPLGDVKRVTDVLPDEGVAVVHMPPHLWRVAIDGDLPDRPAHCCGPISREIDRSPPSPRSNFAAGGSRSASPPGPWAGLPRGGPWRDWSRAVPRRGVSRGSHPESHHEPLTLRQQRRARHASRRWPPSAGRR